jgi:endoglycosylceramidase
MKDYHYRKDANGNPLVEDCLKTPFSMYYLTPEVLTMFRALYYNVGGFQDSYIAYADVIAKKFSSNPYVLGFDPLNEPSPASMGVWDTVKQLIFG